MQHAYCGQSEGILHHTPWLAHALTNGVEKIIKVFFTSGYVISIFTHFCVILLSHGLLNIISQCMNTKALGEGAFWHSGTSVWNSLPQTF